MYVKDAERDINHNGVSKVCFRYRIQSDVNTAGAEGYGCNAAAVVLKCFNNIALQREFLRSGVSVHLDSKMKKE